MTPRVELKSKHLYKNIRLMFDDEHLAYSFVRWEIIFIYVSSTKTKVDTTSSISLLLTCSFLGCYRNIIYELFVTGCVYTIGVYDLDTNGLIGSPKL